MKYFKYILYLVVATSVYAHADDRSDFFRAVEVDNADEAALRHWQYELGRIAGTGQLPDWAPPAYEPWRLVDASVAARLLRNDPCLRAAVLRWANDAGSTRRLLVRGEPLEELAGIAASHVTARPVAYTHRRG